MPPAPTAGTWVAEMEGRLRAARPVFLGRVLDADRWALLCELLLPERFKSPPADPRPIPPAVAGDPGARVRVMAGRHAAGYALHAPGDAPKPAGADGGRGIEPAGGALTAKQRQVRPASHRRTPGRGVG